MTDTGLQRLDCKAGAPSASGHLLSGGQRALPWPPFVTGLAHAPPHLARPNARTPQPNAKCCACGSARRSPILLEKVGRGVKSSRVYTPRADTHRSSGFCREYTRVRPKGCGGTTRDFYNPPGATQPLRSLAAVPARRRLERGTASAATAYTTRRRKLLMAKTSR